MVLRRDESGRVIDLRYRQHSEHTDVRAKQLVVACDGRGSQLRKAANLQPKPVTDLLEVLWFRLPREDTDPDTVRSGLLTGGRLPFILLERPTHFQIAAVIKPGTFSQVRAEGLLAFHERIREAAPELFDRAVTTLDATHLALIQRCRETPTRLMQSIQRITGRRILTSVASDESKRLGVSLAMRLLRRLPGIRALMPRLIALGWRRTHCKISEYFQA